MTQVIPALVDIAIKRGRAVYVGDGVSQLLTSISHNAQRVSGTNRWDCVHISDLGDLYVLIFGKAVADIEAGHLHSTDPLERFYWGSAYSCALGEISRAIAPILFERKLIEVPEAVSVPSIEEFPFVSTNSRTVSTRAFREGWKPHGPRFEEVFREDIFASLASLGYQQ